MLAGEEKASYFYSNKTVTGIAQCYSYFIVHYSFSFGMLHHAKLCSILCGFLAEETNYGSIIMLLHDTEEMISEENELILNATW